MNTRYDYIAVFDSGVGGISVLRHLVKQMPGERYLYFGDSANAPYGSRSTEEVRQLTLAAARKLMEECGKSTQLLTSFEPDMAALGIWWQGLFTETADSVRTGMVPLSMTLSADRAVLDQLIRITPQRIFETLLRFEAPEKAVAIARDMTGLDGLQELTKGKTLSDVQEDAFFRLQDSHAELGAAVMTLECPPLCVQTLGELIWFFLLSRALSQLL